MIERKIARETEGVSGGAYAGKYHAQSERRPIRNSDECE